MSTQLTHSEYETVFAEFTKRTSEYTSIFEWMQFNSNLLKLDTISNVLSVGGGTGNFDIALSKYIPNLVNYNVLEPNSAHIDIFKTNIGIDTRFKFYNDYFNETTIPKEQDLVILSHCLYYLDRQLVFDILPKITKSVLIFHQTEFGINKLQKKYIPNNSTTYCSADIEIELRHRKIKYKKYRIDSHIDVSNPNSDLINFFLEQKTSLDQQRDIIYYLDKHHPSRKMYHPVDIIKIDF